MASIRNKPYSPISCCWNCGALGHTRYDCQRPKIVSCSYCRTMNVRTVECSCQDKILYGLTGPILEPSHTLRLVGPTPQLMIDVRILTENFPVVVSTGDERSVIGYGIARFLGTFDSKFPTMEQLESDPTTTVPIPMEIGNTTNIIDCAISWIKEDIPSNNLPLIYSEDSDGEGGLGNVSRVIIRPPGQSGKAKRGHLCFDAAFETGNLGRADLVGEFEYDLFLRPDTCNPRYRFWFNFTVDNVKMDQRVIFNVVNISKSRNLFAEDLTPLVKSSSRPKWQRIPKHHVFYYRSGVHQNHYVLSFAFSFDKEDDVYQFAIAPPYSYSRLQSYLNVIESRTVVGDKRFERSLLGKSLQNRNLDLITIDHVPKSSVTINNRNFIRVIVVLARSHPGDSPASYVCQGFIDFLIGNHPIASILRENFVFKIIPMVNPDGVFLGNNRCNMIGQDLNRTWHMATEFSHPTLFAIKNMLRELDNSDYYQIDFVIDLHAHSSLHGSFICGNTYEDVYRYERHLVFPRLFAGNAHDYAASNMVFNADEKKAGSARRFCCERLSDTVNAYSLEISMGGYYLKDGKTVTLYTEDGYSRLGRNLARTLLQYYRFINILPVPLVPEILPKRRNRPRTHHSRSRSKTRYEVKPRPKTTRCYAPISYTDLSICYESATSDEGGSPIRQPSSHFAYRYYRKQPSLPANKPQHDQFSLLTIKSAKFDNLDFSSDPGNRSAKKLLPRLPNQQTTDFRLAETLNVPPKPYLSIIDFNQLTRGSLEKATAKAMGKIRRNYD